MNVRPMSIHESANQEIINQTIRQSVPFNPEKAKKRMKEMLAQSDRANHRLINIHPNAALLPSSKPHVTNTIELHHFKIAELIKQNEVAENTHSLQESLLKFLIQENSDTCKLIGYYKMQNELAKKQNEEIENEDKKIKYREELIIEDSKKELEQNIAAIQSLKDECLVLEKELSSKDYHLHDLKHKTESHSNKLDYVSIELEDKIKYKAFKQNELLLKEKEMEELKAHITNINIINSDYVDYLRMLHNDYQESKGNIRVFCRVRPVLSREISEANLSNLQTNYIEYPNYNTVVLSGPIQKSNVGRSKDIQYREIYKFDRVFNPSDSQEEVFIEISQLVRSALDGYKVCIFAYGQTGSGKTYTMEGEDNDKRGIIPRCIEMVFEVKSNLESMGWKFTIETTCFEIYMDQVRDLLMSGTNNVIPQYSKMDKFTSLEVKAVDDWYLIHELAKQKRSVAETQCNENSSRSHCIFQIKITGKNLYTKQERQGALNLIDLAGSERISKSKVEDERLKETISINKSLTALKSVITALVSINSKQSYIPYRDSILTYHLQNFLGGDSKTLMFVNISPLMANFAESSSSLKFASDVNSCYLKSSEVEK